GCGPLVGLTEERAVGAAVKRAKVFLQGWTRDSGFGYLASCLAERPKSVGGGGRRHYRAATRAGNPGAIQGRGRTHLALQGSVSFHHEPRTAHATECDPGVLGIALRRPLWLTE